MLSCSNLSYFKACLSYNFYDLYSFAHRNTFHLFIGLNFFTFSRRNLERELYILFYYQLKIIFKC